MNYSSVQLIAILNDSRFNLVGSPYKAVQVWEYCPVLLCKHLVFRYVLPEDMICNSLKLLTSTVL